VGTIIAWGSNIFSLGFGGLSVGAVGDAFSHFGFSIPIPAVDHVFSGFKFLGVILVTAIPFGIYDLVEAMDNVESASAAGDSFPTTQVLTADGVISLIGCLLGRLLKASRLVLDPPLIRQTERLTGAEVVE
jgi:AGZA family xanthine/uracil permease-like MFS transporter